MWLSFKNWIYDLYFLDFLYSIPYDRNMFEEIHLHPVAKNYSEGVWAKTFWTKWVLSQYGIDLLKDHLTPLYRTDIVARV